MERCECGEEVVERGIYYYCETCGSKYRAIIVLEKVNGPVTLLQEFLKRERLIGTDLRRIPGVRPPVFLNVETK